MELETKVKVEKETKSLPKLEIKKYLTEEDLGSVSGTTPSFHTDGTRCDTSGGCQCGS